MSAVELSTLSTTHLWHSEVEPETREEVFKSIPGSILSALGQNLQATPNTARRLREVAHNTETWAWETANSQAEYKNLIRHSVGSVRFGIRYREAALKRQSGNS